MAIEHVPTQQRFVARLPEGDAILAYHMVSADLMNIESTNVPASARGRGIGGQLVEAALTHARTHGLRVVADCWYVPIWVAKHPEFGDLFED